LTADNRKLREDIQHFRNQRGVFETQYKRQRKDLAHKKQDQVIALSILSKSERNLVSWGLSWLSGHSGQVVIYIPAWRPDLDTVV